MPSNRAAGEQRRDANSGPRRRLIFKAADLTMAAGVGYSFWKTGGRSEANWPAPDELIRTFASRGSQPRSSCVKPRRGRVLRSCASLLKSHARLEFSAQTSNLTSKLGHLTTSSHGPVLILRVASHEEAGERGRYVSQDCKAVERQK